MNPKLILREDTYNKKINFRFDLEASEVVKFQEYNRCVSITSQKGWNIIDTRWRLKLEKEKEKELIILIQAKKWTETVHQDAITSFVSESVSIAEKFNGHVISIIISTESVADLLDKEIEQFKRKKFEIQKELEKQNENINLKPKQLEDFKKEDQEKTKQSDDEILQNISFYAIDKHISNFSLRFMELFFSK